MPPPHERAGNICVYVVSCFLLLAIIGGGVFLVLYMILPESDDTAWFSTAGMVLVGTPWLFWAVTFMYRIVSIRIAAHGGGADRPPARAAAVAPAAAGGTATAVEGDAVVDSPGGARRVRFGAATVLDGPQEVPGGGGGGSSDKPDREAVEEINVDGSSHASHESELPLFAK